MSSLTKVKTVRLTGNTKLASVTPPSSTVLAEPVAPISVVLYSNALTGEYTKAVAGSETTPYAQVLSNQLNLQVSKHLLKLMLLKLIGQLLEVLLLLQDIRLSHIICMSMLLLLLVELQQIH